MNENQELKLVYENIDRKLFDQYYHMVSVFKSTISIFFHPLSVNIAEANIIDLSLLLELYIKLSRKAGLTYLEFNTGEVLLLYSCADLSSKQLLTEIGDSLGAMPGIKQAMGISPGFSTRTVLLQFNQKLIEQFNTEFAGNLAFEKHRTFLDKNFPPELLED